MHREMKIAIELLRERLASGATLDRLELAVELDDPPREAAARPKTLVGRGTPASSRATRQDPPQGTRPHARHRAAQGRSPARPSRSTSTTSAARSGTWGSATASRCSTCRGTPACTGSSRAPRRVLGDRGDATGRVRARGMEPARWRPYAVWASVHRARVDRLHPGHVLGDRSSATAGDTCGGTTRPT